MRGVSAIAALSLVAGTLTATAVASVAAPPAAQAVDRITQQSGFNARAWSVTSPDSTGTRYVGGDFTSYKAWDTGIGGVVDGTTGAVDASFPRVTGWPYAEVIVPDGSGGWYIGGGIGSVGGSGVSRVAHLNADGSLDTSWTPSVSGGQGVWAMAKVGNTLLIGGDFSSVNGVTRTRLAALDATTGALLDWAPTASSTVHTMTVHGDTVYIGGQFTQISGQTRNLAASVRLDARTGGASGTCLDAWDATDCVTSWSPNVGGWGVLAIAVDDTHAWIGGALSSIGGQSRGSLGKVDAATGAVDPWNPALDQQVEGLALDGTTLYVGGIFTSASSQTRNKAAAYDTTTDTLTAWDPNVTGNVVKSISVVGSTVYFGGKFIGVGAEARNHAAAVDTSGAVLPWEPHVCDQGNGAQSTVFGLSAVAGSVYLIGDFPCMGGMKRMHAAAVGPDGLLTSWAPAVNGPVFSFSRSGSTIYMAGNFSMVNNTARSRAAAVDTSGTLLPWAPGFNDRPEEVIATPTKIYLGGWFSTVDGTPRRGLVVVDPVTAAVDMGFDADLDGAVRAMWLEGSRLFIGGDFSTASSQPHRHIAVVDADTGLAEAGFTAETGVGSAIWAFVEAIAVIGDRAYIGGYFGEVNGQTRNYIAAVDATTGALDPTWNPGASNWVFAITPSTDDSTLFVGGNGMTISSGSMSATGVAELDPVTGELTSWQANTGEVRGLSVSDAAVFLAGSFSSVGGQGRQNTAAVDINGNVLDPWPMDPATSVPLVVSVAGTAPGAVVSAPGGINCGASCTYAYTSGSSVTLTAVPATGADFDGWSGACTGSGTTCTVAMSATRSATAQFKAAGSPGGGGSTPNPVYPPSAPRDVAVVSGDGSATVSWTEPATAGTFPVSSYQVATTPASDGCLVSGDDLSCELVDLSNDVDYTVRVRALSGAGWGAWSEPVSTRPAARTSVPGAVRDIEVVRIRRDGSVTLRWRAPLEDGGSRIIGYRVGYRLIGAERYTRVRPDATGTQITITGLTAGRPYWVRIRAENAVGYGPGARYDGRIRIPVG